MKSLLKLLASGVVLLTVFIANTSFIGYGEYTPIFMERSELERSVSYIAGKRDIVSTGKIYTKSPYIFINEKYKGVHVINNSNPYNPVHEGFILAPGCLDMAVKDNILYLDNAVDLVAFDLSTKQETSRIKNVFPEPIPPGHWYVTYDRPQGLILVGWNKKN